MKRFEEETEPLDENSFKVFVRVRPLLPREILNGSTFSIVDVKANNKTLHIYEHMNFEAIGFDEIREQLQNPKYYQIHQFNYDYIFNEKSRQEEVYEIAAKKAIDFTLKGYNSTILAYGQTGTGKTFTMEGSPDSLGIIPQSIQDIFRQIDEGQIKGIKSIKVSYLQIYNEIITDLLSKEKESLMIREDKRKGIFVDGLSEWPVSNPEQIMKMMKRGAQSRPTASTKMNEVSSRSHAIFILSIERSEKKDGVTNHSIGKLNFVDLAGSERIRVTGATGQRLEECKKINQSLAALGNVISALSSKTNRSHIPYRNSKLTRLLEDSLGGNCKTTMIANISPAIDSFNESISTLKFASRAKNIKNTPSINGEIEYDPQILLKKYEDELKNLRARSEAQELENMVEANAKDDARDRDNYGDLNESGDMGYSEADNKDFLESQSELDKYKSLLLRQRDIMIAMTARLNNRDETIINLQNEIEHLNQRNLDLENELVKKEVEEGCFNESECKRGSSPSKTSKAQVARLSEVENKLDSIKGYAENLKNGLDLVFNVLSKENSNIDLGTIAQKLLKIQGMSHKLYNCVFDKAQQPSVSPRPQGQKPEIGKEGKIVHKEYRNYGVLGNIENVHHY